METVIVPKEEYFSMKQKIADLQAKVNYLQDEEFMKNLNFFISLYYKDLHTAKKIESENKIQFSYGAAKDLIHISDDFNETPEEFNEHL